MADWVPLFQTLTWVALISAVLVAGRQKWSGIVTAVESRIKRGDGLSIDIMGMSAQLHSDAVEAGFTVVSPADDEQTTLPNSSDITKRRAELGREQRGLHLVHVVAPSNQEGQRYEVAAYLSGWKRSRFGDPDDLSDVTRAEFALGPLFSPSGVTVPNKGDGHIGIVTAMHAPALCLCRVTFTDGSAIELSRYLDFESGDLARDAFESHG